PGAAVALGRIEETRGVDADSEASKRGHRDQKRAQTVCTQRDAERSLPPPELVDPGTVIPDLLDQQDGRSRGQHGPDKTDAARRSSTDRKPGQPGDQGDDDDPDAGRAHTEPSSSLSSL